MKKSNLYFILLLVVASLFLDSCKTRGLIEKRRYTKGYYLGFKECVAKSHKHGLSKQTNTIDVKRGETSALLQGQDVKEVSDIRSQVFNKVVILDSLTTSVKKNDVKLNSSLTTNNKIKSKAKATLAGKRHKQYGNTLDDYFAWFILILLVVLYCLLVYGWMLLLAGILAISIMPVIPVGIVVFGVLMAGLTLCGAYYLFNLDKGDKLKWWQVLLITELLIPLIAALVIGLLYLSSIK